MMAALYKPAVDGRDKCTPMDIAPATNTHTQTETQLHIQIEIEMPEGGQSHIYSATHESPNTRNTDAPALWQRA
jgi:hypothetical protein